MAKEHPRYALMSDSWPDWEFVEFPMMVYPGAADQKKPYGPNGRPLPGVIVNSPEEADEVLGIDRSAPATAEEDAGREEPPVSPPPAPARKIVATTAKGVSRMETPEDQRAEMIAEAERLGIRQFDKSWSPARMQDTIDTFKAGEGRAEVV